jgi:membrane protein implicated in regulation of membrane protease activity
VPEWVIWILLAIALAVGEVLTLTFFLGAIALAAVAAGLLALAGVSVVVQLVVFIGAAAGSVLLLRPLARSHLRTPAKLRTGTAALVGARAVVLERVDAGGGQVKIGGEVWSARAYFDDQVLEPGQRVEVARIEGATALVFE